MSQSFVFIGTSRAGMALAERLLNAGFLNAPSMESADVIFTLCTNQSALEDVYFESGGIISNARPGAYVVDLSPTTPSFAREFSALALVNDLHPVEAPLFVRDCLLPRAFSESENLVLLTAGEQADINAVSCMLEVLAEQVNYCGGAGSAQALKASLSMQQAVGLLALAESRALLESSLSTSDVAKLTSFSLEENLIPDQLFGLSHTLDQECYEGEFEYTLEILLAELEAALSSVDDAGLNAPVAEAAQYLVQLLAMVGAIDKPVSIARLAYASDEAGKAHGLDWSRIQEHCSDSHCSECDDDSEDYFDDFDDENFEYEQLCECGHHHGHHHDHDDDCSCAQDYKQGFDLDYPSDYFGDWPEN